MPSTYTKRIGFKATEETIFKYAEKKGGKNYSGYIKSLILQDMARDRVFIPHNEAWDR